MAADEYVGYEHHLIDRTDDGILVVAFNRPEAYNAMTYAMHTELTRLWPEIAADRLTKAVVVTGTGKAFSAGNDLKQPDPSPEKALELIEEGLRIAYGILDLPQPIVSAINGVAVGAGLAVALLADVSVVAEDARLIEGHTKVGVVAGDHACLVWPLTAGMAKTKYYVLLNEPLVGTEAERIGLVTMAVPAEQVMPRALEVARALAAQPQGPLRAKKAALDQWLRRAKPIFEQSIYTEALGFFGEDINEARTAFREKREPVFRSRF
jgi:enoyl-CoA hydratase